MLFNRMWKSIMIGPQLTHLELETAQCSHPKAEEQLP